MDNSQSAADAALTQTLLTATHKKISAVATELQTVLRSFDNKNTGHLSRSEVTAGCAALGVMLSEQELNALTPLFKTNADGLIDYAHFCSIFSE